MNIYLVLVIILMAIAVVDLIVGVSNDAVNFLNSAIGSKVASFRTILIIASLGILMGSLFSSGMMEIARSGIFNPSFFTFDKVIIIFMAVMITDIILLDFYNSLGLPTSTTVSLIFELLGAALVTGLLYAFDQGMGFETWKQIINYSSAITIIVGIFLSVFLAFITGTIIQHVSRLIFTFNFKRNLKKYGAIFSGIAITTIIYFLLIKGVKGSALVTDSQVSWIMKNTGMILVVFVIFWSIFIQVLMWWQDVNPLKIIVLLGTFSLAMAFAGNDLVNFIGVSVAGLMSFQAWSASGVPASEFNMGILNEKIVTPTLILVGAGIVMTITLWTNAKSRKVTETEISLARQDDGDEKFRPNFLSRALVGSAMWLGRGVQRIVPQYINQVMLVRFKKENLDQEKLKQDPEKPSFDLIRASINLIVSSALIAYGTSQKLPLSTTFVTFMVAMGTSFADQAWGRESAVYRVAGVMNVIAGWLITAIVAILTSGLFALIMYHTGIIGMLALSGLAGFLIIRSHVVFKRKSSEEKISNQVLESPSADIHQVISESKSNTIKNLKTVRKVTLHSIQSLLKEDGNALNKSGKEIKKLKEQNEKLHGKLIKYVQKMEKGNLPAGRLYILVFDLMQDLYQSAQLVNEVCSFHVINHHSPPTKKYQKVFSELEKDLESYIDLAVISIEKLSVENDAIIQDKHDKLIAYINIAIDGLILDIQKNDIGNKLGLLQTRIFLEVKDVITIVERVHTLYCDFTIQSVKKSV
ncbi:MAG: inorganic phosphate transporter [Cyclobacteriaceae bacterium]|nr:inorganic phosphate transporter [Cyclobacteriaceae bacterium]